MFDGLVRFDPEGRVEPDLATAWRWIDDRTLELTLRSGVRFHDGEPFDAEAARFTLERYLNPKTGFPAAGFLVSIDTVEVVDAGTVRIRTKFPDGLLLHRLAGFVLISPPRYITSRGEEYFGTHPVGTGPFKFVQWRKGSRIVLQANKNYWVKGYPKFKRLVFEFMPIAKQVESLLKGDVDVVTELPGTDTLRVMKSGRIKIIKKESFYTFGSSINVSTGPLADRRVRQAINYAINKKELVRYDVLGNGKYLASLTMAGEIGHNPNLHPYPYDPDKALQLLKEAGHPNGVRLRVIVKEQGERTMRIISSQLKRVGIHLDLHKTTDATVIQDIQNHPWDFTFGGCPDPLAHSFFIQSIFLSSLSPYSILRDAAYDKLLSSMVMTLDPQEQDRAGRELDRYIHDEALSVFTYQRIKTYGASNSIHLVPSITGMSYFFLSYPNEK